MTDNSVPFALYDAFSDQLFGGSQGGIVLDAENIDAKTRQLIASELGLPATCFVSSIIDNTVTARFHSTEREYPMCGHGTICLMTHLLQQDLLKAVGEETLEVELVLPTKTAQVEIGTTSQTHPLVMLDIAPPDFKNDRPSINALAQILGLVPNDIDKTNPIETALSDFNHLIVPISSLKAMQSISPDFPAITKFCHENGYETIACYSNQTVHADYDFHVRDFCPAVGVAESAAAGTTNAALAAYFLRNDVIANKNTGDIHIKAEQGFEINRPSTIFTTIKLTDNEITRLQVGGVATKVLEGQVHIPN